MFDKIVDLLSRIGLIIGSTLLVVMVLLTVTDIVMRYLFSAPLPSVAEMTQIMLAITVFAGLILVSRDGSHIMVSLFEPMITSVAPKMYRLLYAISNTLGTAFILYVLILATQESYMFEEVTEALEIPLFWIFGTLMVLAALALVTGITVFKKGRIGHGSAD